MEQHINRLTPRTHPFLRTMWLLWAAVLLLIIFLNMPAQLAIITERLQGNLTAAAMHVAALLAESAGALVSLTLAGVLYFKRPQDRMALFVSYFVLVIGYVLLPFYFLESLWPGVHSFKYGTIVPLIFGPFLIAFLSIFPNGRPVPGWTRWLIIAAIIYAPVSPLLFTAQAYISPTPIYIAGIMVWFALIFSGFFAQIYRYRHVSNPVEKQQTKWVIYAFTIAVIFVFFSTLWTIRLNSQPQSTSIPWYSPLITLGWTLAYSALPISLTLAVMRYRLYDVDLIINRTLVYGALTASVAILYVLVVGGTGLVIQTHTNLMGLLITAVLAVLLIRSLHLPLQRGVDHLMYGKNSAPNKLGSLQQIERTESANHSGETPAPAATLWLKIARLVWYPAALLAVAIFLVSIPGFFIIGSDGALDPRFSASPLPLINAILRVTIIVAILTSLSSLLLAVLLYRRRSDDRMALLTSYLLLGYGVIMAGPFEALEPFVPGIAPFTTSVLIPLFQPFILLLFAVFPDSRFVPRWTRWAILLVFLISPLSIFWTTRLSQSDLDFSQPDIVSILVINIVLFLAILIMILYAQVYRYRHVSTQVQKQQTKWVLYGVGLWFSIQFISSIPWIYAYSLPPNIPYPPWMAVITPIWLFSIICIPLTLTIAVMRYRLFDIDLLINRSLLYGALTVAVIGIYVLVVGALGLFFQAQGNLIVALLATGIIAVLFQPLRERLQRAANRLVYGDRDDPVEALSQLGRRLESALPPDDVLPMLAETIAQTLKLPYVAIQLAGGNEDEVTAEFGSAAQERASFPLIYQGESVGRLIVAPPSPGSSFSSAETRLLINIARQAGAAVHAVQLTTDLQRSRQRLVTAREEERRRLRRDLHDGLGATLAAINLEAGALKRTIRSDPAKAESLADELRQDIRDSIDNIRLLVYELRPPTLDQLGLVEAVRSQARQCSRGQSKGESSLLVKVEAPESLPPLTAAVEVAAYRIAQEALANVLHHAQARHCTIRLEMTDELNLEVIDDGVGLGNGSRSINSLGLLSMRERAQELGGVCLVEEAEGGGTRVLASLPLLED